MSHKNVDQEKIKKLTEEYSEVTPLKQPGHKIRTRRDMFSQGLIGMGAYIALPSIMTLAQTKVALGEECDTKSAAAAGSAMAGMMCIDLAGGAGLAGSNVIVGRNNSQTNFLANYNTNGLPNNMHPETVGMNEEFGLKFHPNSGILAGLLATTSAATRANIEGAVFACISGDDSANNPHSPVNAISKISQRGQLVSILGSQTTANGARGQTPTEFVDLADRSVPIRRITDGEGLARLGALTESIFNGDAASAEKVMKKIQNLSNSRLAKFQEKQLPNELKKIVSCGYTDATGFFTKYDAARLNPTNDTQNETIFNGLNQGLPLGNQGNLRANDINSLRTMAHLIVNGMATAGSIVLPGNDYHNRGRAQQDGTDIRTGQAIGAVLELAAQKGENAVVYVYTDGSVSSRQTIDASGIGAKFEFTSDSGTRSVAFMLAYGANGKPEIRNPGRQVGEFNENGGVTAGFNLITNSPENMTKAVIANFLALHGKEGELSQHMSDPFGADLDSYLVFGKFKDPA